MGRWTDPARRRRPRAKATAVLGAVLLLTGVFAAGASADLPTTDDPRVGLSPGLTDAGVATLGMELLANRPLPGGFVINSDMAFQGDHAFVGSFSGFNVYDISNPSAPTLATSVLCPGGQGDLSVYGNLLFMSVEAGNGRIDCGTQGTTGPVDPERFRGIRVFDISNIASPVQVAAVQTCRGSHTHTFVEAAEDPANVYIYVSGTAGVRPAAELEGCVNSDPFSATPVFDETRSHWRIEVIRVPLAAPQNAAVVNEPRLFRDAQTGALNGLQNRFNGDGTTHPSGNPAAWGPTPNTNHCHDITVYEELDLAAGACSGDGLLIDISDPANPTRISSVTDPNWSYWHGATFSNDGTKVMFTDEWGGGTQARCRATDDSAWGGNAIYEIVNGTLVFRSYYKLPVVQTLQENCVSHIPSVVPVPGRDLFVQAWYQGGASLVDWSDPANPQEIGFWDRGPISNASLVLGGFWSTYWYNGTTYASEIARGFEAFAFTPTADLSANEIAAANEVSVGRLNVQTQERYVNAPSFNVARAYRDQLVRSGDLSGELLENVDRFIDRAEQFQTGPQAQAAKANLKALANQLKHDPRYEDLAEVLIALSRG